MKNKRMYKLLTTLTALIFVLLIQTQYIKSEEKLKLKINDQTAEISDKVEKDNMNQLIIDSEQNDDTNTAVETPITIPGNEPERNENQNELSEEPTLVQPQETPKVEQKPVTNPVVKPQPVVFLKQVEQNISIDFKTESVSDANINQGESKIEVNGVAGNRLIVKQEKYVDGKLVSSNEISNTITLNPVNQVVRKGTKMPTIAIDSDQAKAMFNAMNQSRLEAGKVKLNWSNDLANAASIRSKEISVSFSHTRPNGQKFNTVNPSIVFGENIASASSNALETHQLFMNSAGHRENILDSDFKSVGIATYKISDKPGATYWTVLFNY